MKTIQFGRFAGLSAFLLLGGAMLARADEGTGADREVRPLQVSVQLPPAWEIGFNSDYVSELFTDRVYTQFRRMGYEGKVKYVDVFDERTADDHRLAIRLIEWRLNAVGNVDCAFTAELQAPRGEQSLGVYRGTALHSVTGRGRIWLGDSFEDAADSAIRDLFRDLAERELVPALRGDS